MRTMSSSPCLHFDCLNKNSFGYCRTSVCINELYRGEWTESTSNKTQAVVLNPITNADRIRMMTDEELAEYLFERGNGWENCYGICAYQNECGAPHYRKFCVEQVVKWLKQEAE